MPFRPVREETGRPSPLPLDLGSSSILRDREVGRLLLADEPQLKLVDVAVPKVAHSGGGLMPSGYLRVAALVLVTYNVVNRFASASLVARKWATA
jgi:hypothetical protein